MNSRVLGMHELADFSKAYLSAMTRLCISSMASWTEDFYKKHGLQIVKLVSYFPRGMSFHTIIYDVCSANSLEHLRLFNNRGEAVRWLNEEDEARFALETFNGNRERSACRRHPMSQYPQR